jgi:hypothetical protein
MRRRRSPEIIAGRVNGDGSIATGDGFTVQRTGTGNYIVTFAAGFRMTGFSATVASSNEIFYQSPTDRTINVQTASTAGGALFDGAWAFVAVGTQQ